MYPAAPAVRLNGRSDLCATFPPARAEPTVDSDNREAMTNARHPNRGDRSRREALRPLGTAAGAGLAAAAAGSRPGPADLSSVATPHFPEGATSPSCPEDDILLP